MVKRFTRIFILLVCIIGFSYTGSAQVYQNDFLSIGIGARSQGMAGSVLSSSSDVFSTYWNPAALTRIKEPLQVGAMHAEWFSGVSKHDYLGLAKSLDTLNKSFLGVSVIRNGIDNIPNTLDLYGPDGTINRDNISEFSYASYAIFVSYARALKNPNWRVGANAKVLFQQAGPFGKAFGIGIDLSLLYQKNGFMFAVMGRDITTTYNRWTYSFTEAQKQVLLNTGNEVNLASTEITRPSLLPAVGYQWNFGKYSVLADMMARMTFDGQRNVLISSKAINIDPALGVELGYNRAVFIRAGVGNFQKVKDILEPTRQTLTLRPSFGIGLRFGRLEIDYALSNVGQSSNNRYSHIFSAILSFGGKKVRDRSDI